MRAQEGGVRGGDKGRLGEGEGGMERGRTPGRKRKRERERGDKREGGLGVNTCNQAWLGPAGICLARSQRGGGQAGP